MGEILKQTFFKIYIYIYFAIIYIFLKYWVSKEFYDKCSIKIFKLLLMFSMSISFKIGTLFLKTILFSLLHFLTLFSCKWLQLFFKREKQVSSGYICFMLNLCCVLVAKFDSKSKASP